MNNTNAVKSCFIVPVVSVSICCTAISCNSTEQESKQAHQTARIQALESQVKQLERQLKSMQSELGEMTRPAVVSQQEFDVSCPQSWETFDNIPGAAWACKSSTALPDGMWPNCNVAKGPAEPNLTLKEYFDKSLATVPQLRNAERIQDRSATLGGVMAHEAVYQHTLFKAPMRVLATMAAYEDQIYVLTCSAPVDAYSSLEPMFRQITESFRFKKRRGNG